MISVLRNSFIRTCSAVTQLGQPSRQCPTHLPRDPGPTGRRVALASNHRLSLRWTSSNMLKGCHGCTKRGQSRPAFRLADGLGRALRHSAGPEWRANRLASGSRLAAVAVLLVCCAVVVEGASWSPNPSYPPNALMACAASVGGDLVVVGGVDVSYSQTPMWEVWKFSAEAQVWSSFFIPPDNWVTGTIPPGRESCHAVEVNGQLLVAGGADTNGVEMVVEDALSDAWLFSMVSDGWSREPKFDLPCDSFGASLVSVKNSTGSTELLLMFAGSRNVSDAACMPSSANMFEYDFEAHEWQLIPAEGDPVAVNASLEHRIHPVAEFVVVDGHNILVVLGGRGTEVGDVRSDVLLWNATSRRWTYPNQPPPMYQRYASQSGSIGDTVVSYSGCYGYTPVDEVVVGVGLANCVEVVDGSYGAVSISVKNGTSVSYNHTSLRQPMFHGVGGTLTSSHSETVLAWGGFASREFAIRATGFVVDADLSQHIPFEDSPKREIVPPPRMLAAAVSLFGDSMALLVGGCDDARRIIATGGVLCGELPQDGDLVEDLVHGYLADVYVWHWERLHWERLPDIGFAEGVYGQGMTTVGDTVYLFGGQQWFSPTITDLSRLPHASNVLYRLVATSDRPPQQWHWEEVLSVSSNLPTGRFGACFAARDDDHLVLMGGMTSSVTFDAVAYFLTGKLDVQISAAPTSDLWEFEISTGTWTAMGATMRSLPGAAPELVALSWCSCVRMWNSEDIAIPAGLELDPHQPDGVATRQTLPSIHILRPRDPILHVVLPFTGPQVGRRLGVGVVSVGRDRILIMAGKVETESGETDAWVANVRTGEWQPVTVDNDGPNARIAPIVARHGASVLIAGGIDSSQTKLIPGFAILQSDIVVTDVDPQLGDDAHCLATGEAHPCRTLSAALAKGAALDFQGLQRLRVGNLHIAPQVSLRPGFEYWVDFPLKLRRSVSMFSDGINGETTAVVCATTPCVETDAALEVAFLSFRARRHQGRGIVLDGTSSSLFMESVAFSDFVSTEQTGYGHVPPGGGAIVAVSSARVTIVNSTFSYCHAVRGGAILAMASTVVVSNSSFHANSAVTSGGALSLVFSTYAGEGNSFTNNSVGAIGRAGASGGALHCEGNMACSMHLSVFNDNHAIGDGAKGGAVAAQSCSPQLTSSWLVANRATSKGGAIHGSGVASIAIKNSEAVLNSAGFSGGVLDCESCTSVLLADSKLRENSCGPGGGGAISVELQARTVEVLGSQIVSSHAQGSGGVLSILGGASRLTFEGCTLVDSVADGGGGVLFFDVNGGAPSSILAANTITRSRAMFGTVQASIGLSLQVHPHRLSCQSGGLFTTAVSARLVDFFNNTVTTLGMLYTQPVFHVSIVGGTASLVGSPLLLGVNGVGVLDQHGVIGEPGSSVTLQIDATGDGVSSTPQVAPTTFTVDIGLCRAGEQAASGGGLSCELCAAGWSSAGGSTEAGACKRCVAGRYASQRGSSRCSACAPGSFASDAGSFACSSCASGYAQPVFGGTGCQACRPGFFAGTEGAADCVPCPAGRVAQLHGSAECVDCKLGTFASSDSSVCISCPGRGFECNNGILSAMQGYWSPVTWNESHRALVTPQNLLVMRCAPTAACLTAQNGSWFRCNTKAGYSDSPLCKQCLHGFARTIGGTCSKCSDSGVWDTMLAVVYLCCVLAVIALLVARRIRNSERGLAFSNTAGVLRIGLNFLQGNSVMARFRVEAPGTLAALLSTSSFADGISLADMPSIRCATDLGFFARVFMTAFVGPSLCVLIVMVLAMVYAARWGQTKVDAGGAIAIRFWHWIQTAALMVMFLCFNVTVRELLSIYSYYPELRVLRDDVGISIDSTNWWIASVCGAALLLLYVVALPVLLAAFLSRAARRGRLGTRSFDGRFGFVYEGLRREHYLWETVVVLRKVALNAALVLVDADPFLQSFYGVFVFVTALCLHLAVQPYQNAVLNVCESVSLAGSIVTQMIVILAWRLPNAKVSLGAVGSSMQVGVVLFLAGVVAWNALARRGTWFRGWGLLSRKTKAPTLLDSTRARTSASQSGGIRMNENPMRGNPQVRISRFTRPHTSAQAGK